MSTVNRSQAIRDYKKSHPSVANWKEVQAALSVDGVKVSDSLCQKVYYEKGKKPAKKADKPAKKAPVKKPAKKAPAKKKGSKAYGSKSEAVRNYFTLNADASVKDCIAALKTKGLTVSAALVHNVRFGMKHRRKNLAAVARRAGNRTTRTGRKTTKAASFTVANLIEAKNFVKAIGDRKTAVELIETLELLKS